MLRLIQTSVFWTGLGIFFILMTLFVYMIFIKDQADLALYRMLGFGSERLRSHYLLAVCFILMLALAIADLRLLFLWKYKTDDFKILSHITYFKL